MSKRAIEESFPIVEINRLALPERTAFKPIYTMHKWFARRASCIFRGILLGALKPAGTDLMAEFYKDHGNDPDTQGKVILDPFMGGGTTVVEALRLGCKVTGIDLSPVAWFVVKTQVEPVDLSALDAAFARLAARPVSWSGKPLRETLLDLYRSDAPWTDSQANAEALPESDVIYTFWVKAAPCTSPTCRKPVPLFSDYVIAAKSPTVRYHPDCTCPRCEKQFDWEIEPAALVADPRLMVHAASYSGGTGRATTRWTYAYPDGGIFVTQGEAKGGQGSVRHGQVPAGHVCCPHCFEIVQPSFASSQVSVRGKIPKPKRKKIPLTVLLCPHTEEVFQWRGELAEDACVRSPSGSEFTPYRGNLPEKGRFVCPHCGNNDAVIAAIRSLPESERFPLSAYAVQAYASCCDPRFLRDGTDEDNSLSLDLIEADPTPAETEPTDDEVENEAAGVEFARPTMTVPRTANLVWLQKGKYFAQHSPADLTRYQEAERQWKDNADRLPHPKSEIPPGFNTNQMTKHNYRRWSDMFLPRQLLALSSLLEAILAEQDQRMREQFMLCLSATTDTNNGFTRFMAARDSAGGQTAQGVFARHDFQPKMTVCEQNVWGLAAGGIGTFVRRFWQTRQGVSFALKSSEVVYTQVNGKRIRTVREQDNLYRAGKPNPVTLLCQSSTRIAALADASVDFVITDPPYSDNVHYSELADFYYVWTRLGLKSSYPHYIPEITPKTEEVVKNDVRGKTEEDFGRELTRVFAESRRVLKPEGLMAFTFHHAEDSAWVALLEAICNAGFVVEAIYPIQSEGGSSLHIKDKEAIAYDLIHVCRPRLANTARRSWAGLKAQVRRRAQEEIRQIETGRYGGSPLPAPDIRMVIIGKCLEVYSQHFGAVIDWQGEPLPLRAALQDIRLMVEQIASSEHPLPSELENADAITQVWLLALSNQREITVDSLSKTTRGVFEVSDLTDHKPPLLHKKRANGGRSWAILTPAERITGLRNVLMKAPPTIEQLDLGIVGGEKSVVVGPPLVDVLHLLLASAEIGERLDPLIDFFNAQRGPIRAALEWLKARDPDRWAKSCDLLLGFYSDVQLTSLISPTKPTS